MNTYRVTIRFQFPAWNERDGIPYTMTAKSKAKAISYVRRQARDDGHIPAIGKGRVTISAKEMDETVTN